MGQIVYRNIKDLHLLENNPRKISVNEMEKLITSIQNNHDYFEARPLILSDRTGELIILAGNQRYKAAKKSGTTMVAAHQLGRNCYMMEYEPHYCQVIIDRMNKLDPGLNITKIA